MNRYTDFTLYWERWGGYPDRDEPFGMPELLWVVASADRAALCSVESRSEGASKVSWNAGWRQLPWERVAPLPALLEEAGAFGEPVSLTAGAAAGDYLMTWNLTGALRERPFHLSLQSTEPREWTPLARRLCEALSALRT